MKEVSCRFFETLLRDLKERGLDPTQLVAGTPYTLRHLANKDERIDWSAFLQMMENGHALWTPEQLIRIGERSTESPLVQFIGVVARVRFSVGGFFHWVAGPEGIAKQMFNTLATSCQGDGKGRVIIELLMLPGYERNEELFLVSQGTYAAMPRMLGAPPAIVTSVPLANGVRFHIEYTEPRGVIPAIRKAVSWPFRLRQAADELADAHTSLMSRYRELESARTDLERQREQLALAYELGQRIWRERDLAVVGDIVMQCVLARAGVRGVRLQTFTFDDELAFTSGDLGGVPRAVVALPGTPSRGMLEVWSDRVDDTRALLELIAPTVALSLDNVHSDRELVAYRTGLEQLVVERTTELTHARDQLAGTVDKLRDAQGAQRRFFGNISHEIRTPLSLILLAAGDIQARAGALLDPRSRAGLDAVSDSARKLVRLVDELLLLAAGQEDKLKLRPEHTDLAALVRNMIAAWIPAAEAAGLELDAQLPTSLLAQVDPTAIERVASNLVSNAVKYTPRGGRVELALTSDADGIHLAVLDSGIGISDELATRLFGRFERDAGDAGRDRIGTGLGLALVKQLVEAHGGSITAARRPEGGTALRVTLPASLVIAEGASDIVAIGRPPRPVASSRLEDYGVVTGAAIASGTVLTPPGVSRGTILLAEDDARLASMIAHLLADHYTVVVALDGFAALTQVKLHQPQLLITDVDMPGMSGIELSRKFREVTGDRLAPIIILSAVHDLGTRVAGLEAGAVDYVTKPFDPVELEARVAAQFRMRDLALRLHRAEQLSALGILTAGLAHELRNPANGIVNAIEPLMTLLPKDISHPDTGVGQLLEVMTSCANQIEFLARQLLSFRTGVGKLELRPVAASELVRRAITLAERALEGVDVRVAVSTSIVHCTPPLMIQVLTNLIENAGHAAGRGGWVAISTHTVGGRITLEVADSGGGVPHELRDRVFEPFFTTKAPGIGTGLGLPLARDIVLRHGGLLEIRDRDARSVFVIDLPDDPLSANVKAV